MHISNATRTALVDLATAIQDIDPARHPEAHRTLLMRLRLGISALPMRDVPDTWDEGADVDPVDAEPYLRALTDSDGVFEVAYPIIEDDEDGDEQHYTTTDGDVADAVLRVLDSTDPIRFWRR